MMDLILGYGEVGKALGEVLGERREILIHDPKKGHIVKREGEEEIDWLHVTFPYSKSFKDDVCAYWLDFRPKHIVIHSTVPVGTTLHMMIATKWDATSRLAGCRRAPHHPRRYWSS